VGMKILLSLNPTRGVTQPNISQLVKQCTVDGRLKVKCARGGKRPSASCRRLPLSVAFSTLWRAGEGVISTIPSVDAEY